MNRQTAQKAELFIDSVINKLDEQGGGIDVTFKSGLKKYSFASEMNENGLKFNFTGRSYEMTPAELKAFITDNIPLYDEMEFVYHEDGSDTVILADSKNVSVKTNVRQSDDGQKDEYGFSMSNRAYYIRPEKAGKMLKAIGVMGSNGRILNDKIRKYNQIDHFIELIDPMLRKLCEDKQNQKDRTINIVDCACGKSYLSFAVYYYITEVLGGRCHITGLDYNKIVIEDSKKIAFETCYKNMKFVETDISKYEPDRKYDMMITLHACDIATDYALRFAIDNDVKSIVCVPCCHKEMNSQNYKIPGLESVLKYGILKARVADSLTDALRANYLEAIGYEVSMVEYISPLDTPKNLMMRCVKKGGIDAEKMGRFAMACNLLGVKLSIDK